MAGMRDATNFCNGYDYRYVAACGLERRKITSGVWSPVNGPAFEAMTADELEHCAKVMRKAFQETPHEHD